MSVCFWRKLTINMKKIITDSAANLNVTALNGIEHQSVDLTLVCGDKVFLDGANFDQASSVVCWDVS